MSDTYEAILGDALKLLAVWDRTAWEEKGRIGLPIADADLIDLRRRKADIDKKKEL